MSKVKGLTKRKGADVWSYDFIIGGHRFCGTTGLANQREAAKWLAEFRARKQSEIAQYDGREPMTFGVASTRWWREKGQHRKDAKDVERFLGWLQMHIGKNRLVSAIDNSLVARLVHERREDDVTTATVNRSVTEPLRAIMKYAEMLEQPVKRIDWGKHLLKEAAPRIRELSSDEEARLFAALRPDYHPIIRFLLVTGVRRAEAVNLRWEDVDLAEGLFTVHAKGGLVDRRPLPQAALAILSLERTKHHEKVFTYQAQRGTQKGQAVPICLQALDTVWHRSSEAAGLHSVRLHDLRHTSLTRIARARGIQVAQKIAGHKKVTTTQRYAHVTEQDMRDALNAVFPVVAEVKKEKKA